MKANLPSFSLPDNRHPFAKNPEEWLATHAESLQGRLESGNQTYILGCSDPRVCHTNQLSIPGSGVVSSKRVRNWLHDLVAAGKLLEIQTHDDCVALKQAGITTAEEMAERGAQLAETLGITHRHIPNTRQVTQADQLIYLDTTNAIQDVTQLGLPPGFQLSNVEYTTWFSMLRERPSLPILRSLLTVLLPRRSVRDRILVILGESQNTRVVRAFADAAEDLLADRDCQLAHAVTLDNTGMWQKIRPTQTLQHQGLA
jgi:hypothetical protein